METYGLTETASMICTNPLPPAVRKVGSVGYAFGAEICIANAEGRHLPPGQHGEIIVRGPSVIEQYAGSQAQPDAFFGNWLRTGDLGYLDEDGYLFIVGRAKELIKRGGLSVYPAEIDNKLNAHPSVADAIAFSLPHPTLGEELVAAVVPRANTTLSVAELKAYLARGLSSYKVPTEIVLVPAIPKNETGKALRREMATKLASAFAPRSEPPESELEGVLLRAWQSVLSRADVGVTDNVFVFGADPLRAERVSQMLQEQSGITMSARMLLSLPTVREQAAHSGT
jgi:acyl-CoA synthetase (AMP-forming)/AMP-acid ligase II